MYDILTLNVTMSTKINYLCFMLIRKYICMQIIHTLYIHIDSQVGKYIGVDIDKYCII